MPQDVRCPGNNWRCRYLPSLDWNIQLGRPERRLKLQYLSRIPAIVTHDFRTQDTRHVINQLCSARNVASGSCLGKIHEDTRREWFYRIVPSLLQKVLLRSPGAEIARSGNHNHLSSPAKVRSLRVHSFLTASMTVPICWFGHSLFINSEKAGIPSCHRLVSCHEVGVLTQRNDLVKMDTPFHRCHIVFALWFIDWRSDMSFHSAAGLRAVPSLHRQNCRGPAGSWIALLKASGKSRNGKPWAVLPSHPPVKLIDLQIRMPISYGSPRNSIHYFAFFPASASFLTSFACSVSWALNNSHNPLRPSRNQILACLLWVSRFVVSSYNDQQASLLFMPANHRSSGGKASADLYIGMIGRRLWPLDRYHSTLSALPLCRPIHSSTSLQSLYLFNPTTVLYCVHHVLTALLLL